MVKSNCHTLTYLVRRKKKIKRTPFSSNNPSLYQTLRPDNSDMSKIESTTNLSSRRHIHRPNVHKKTKIKIEKEFETVENILANKRINYGYGDSKNREKVLRFITEMKNRQM